MTIYPVSPNTVLANALSHAEDVLSPRILDTHPERIVLVVGTQINGAPHIGTSLVQTLTFATAARLRQKFGVPTNVVFAALDNAPHTVVTDGASGHRYQRAYVHALGEQAIVEQVDQMYRPLFDALSHRLKVPYEVDTYTQQQAAEHFRRTWLRVLPRMDAARWYLAPSSGVAHVRVPCPVPDCGWAEKYAERTRVHPDGPEHATVTAVCLHHGAYEVTITPTDGGYLDLATLYRNLVKELALTGSHGTMHVMVKGTDWMPGSQLVDGALQAVGLSRGQLPARLFCPQIVTDTGAKLSKSLIREGRAALPVGAAPWMLDTREWPGSFTEYVDRLLDMVEVVLSDPRHFFRSYSAGELARMMTEPIARSVPAP
ncbi:tRNA synthetase [Streptomyces phage Picard]|uniref:tRNA synthetase n=2 Tax=Picardvirus picard TaxID=2734264 RepID=A0A1J0MCI8_9CAUD|nr:tRNA synthetase [Streptomyces phage Picard]APD18558.1 tRNA synthetase [Streptomyces phage Picard]APD18669.1 tRNA synthetase [Streptomyces phage Mojorita]